MAQDAWLAAFLMAGPTVAIEDEKLRLTTDEATVELTDLGPAEPKEPVDPGSADDPVSNEPDAPSLPDPGSGSSLPPPPAPTVRPGRSAEAPEARPAPLASGATAGRSPGSTSVRVQASPDPAGHGCAG